MLLLKANDEAYDVPPRVSSPILSSGHPSRHTQASCILCLMKYPIMKSYGLSSGTVCIMPADVVAFGPKVDETTRRDEGNQAARTITALKPVQMWAHVCQ